MKEVPTSAPTTAFPLDQRRGGAVGDKTPPGPARGQLRAAWTPPVLRPFWDSVSLPGHWWPLGLLCHCWVGWVLCLQPPGPGLEAAAAQPPGPAGPHRSTSQARGAARVRTGDATSSFKEQTKVLVPGKTAGGQAGGKVHQGGPAVHSAAPTPPALWPGPVAGTGPAPLPFWHLPGTSQGCGNWHLGARTPFAPHFPDMEEPGGRPLSRSQSGAAAQGAEDGKVPQPLPAWHPESRLPAGPERTCPVDIPDMAREGGGPVAVCPMATHSGCSPRGPTCLS